MTVNRFLLPLFLYLTVISTAAAQVSPAPKSVPQPGMPSRGAGVDASLEQVEAADALLDDEGQDLIETAAEIEEIVEPEPKLSRAEIASMMVREYATALGQERLALDYVTQGHLELMRSNEYLRILPTQNRRSLVDAPFGMRGQANRPKPELAKLGLPTNGRLYVTDSTIDALVDWYADNYGFEFIIHRTTIPGFDGEQVLTVARSVKRIENTLVTVMLWNPAIVSSGSRRNKRVEQFNRTNVSITERAYRHRLDLIVEGPDAIVELTWNVPYSKLIQDASARYQVDPFLIAALVQQESGFNATAISVDSAMGLTQLIPGTAALVGVSDPYNPSQAINGGVRYLKMMLRRYRGDVRLALAAYNAGPGNVDKYKGIPPFKETQNYVRRIMARYEEKATAGVRRKG